jgi:hypothetical protein
VKARQRSAAHAGSVKKTLPPQIREEVERRMWTKGFSDYEGLADWVREQGYEISDDSLWRYGKSLKREFTATPFAVRQARMLADEARDHKAPCCRL